MTEITTTDWMDKYSKQVMGYKELDKFKPGDSLHLQYYPVPEEEIKAWQKEKDRIAMQNYEEKLKQQEETKKALLELREEETRENGHDNENNVPIEIPIKYDELNLTKICKDCDKHTIFCDCRDNPKLDKIAKGESERYPNLKPDHCDLKKSRKSKKK